jgi:hypothetical protein
MAINIAGMNYGDCFESTAAIERLICKAGWRIPLHMSRQSVVADFLG